MTISYSTSLLNWFIAPGISELTACDAPDISAKHPQASHWLANHFLNSVLRGSFKNKYRQYALNLIFRAQTAFAEYHDARSLTVEFLGKGRPDYPASRTYFRAIARWEACFLNLQIFIDVLNKLKRELNDQPVFKDCDGTPEQRAYEMANTVKHWGADVSANRHSESDTIPLWITNLGLQTHLHQITYSELAALISEAAKIAEELQDPMSFGEAK